MPGTAGISVTRSSLLARLREAGDEAAWWEFDRLYRDLILGYANRLGMQPADAEDVRQTVMMNLARAMPRFEYDRSQGRFRSYLRTAIRNAVRNQFRRPDHATVELMEDEDVDPRTDVAGEWEREWMNHHYRLAMRTIRETFKTRSLEMFDDLLAGETVAQVAEKYDVSTEAVYKIKHRIRDRLAELIAEQVREEDE